MDFGGYPSYFVGANMETAQARTRRKLQEFGLIKIRHVASVQPTIFLKHIFASVWDSLRESVRASPSLQVFRIRLKTELFARSYSSSD